MSNSSNEIVERVITLDEYQPHPRNYNKHPQAQIERLVYSLDKFGQVRNIVVWRQWFIAGHGVAQAAVESGRTTLRANVIPDDWPEERVLAYLAADNELGKLSQADDAQLLAILDEVKQFDHELLLASGFDQERFDDLIRSVEAGLEPENAGKDVEPEIDKAEELRQKWGVQPGQLWQLGDHRIICGDCTDRAVVERLMEGEKADLCLTDPPYGLGDTVSDKNEYNEYDDTKENLVALISKFLPIAQDIAVVTVLTPGNSNQSLYPPPTWIMAWFTPAGVGMGPWGFCCWQPMLCYGKDPKLAKRKGSYPDAIVHTESSEDFGHPCAKPIKFWEWLMNRTSEPGETIYEPFSGSGTTIIACENLSRKCRAVEISPGYVAIALERWHQLTGKTPTLVE